MTPPGSNDIHGRVQVLETRFDHVDRTLGDLTKLIKEIASQPRALPLKEIAMTVAAVLGVMAYVGNFLEAQSKKNIAVLEYRTDLLDRKIQAIPQLMFVPSQSR